MSMAKSKVTAEHLRRDAYLYVRQSSLHQVVDNSESTKRQYALRQRAVALGWPLERVVVIDEDLGRSAAGSVDRTGFERLVGDVGVGRAGIVLGLEVSRLARSSTDWHRLLEICALTDTLLLDEDGLYDPSHFNDRLLLGLKGTMSEAELHVIEARLQGGIRNKARRGELKIALPVGLVYDAADRVVRDPDQRVQEAVGLVFETFRRAGSATAVVRHFRSQDLLFPTRLRNGPRRGELVFGPLLQSRVLAMLRSPRYAGAYAYGRTRTRPKPDGGNRVERLPREQWQVLIPEAHEGYISWERYEDNLRRLRENAQAHGNDRRRSPPREGPALLQGLVVCGRCGYRMTVSYRVRTGNKTAPIYRCDHGHGGRGDRRTCQSLVGSELDEAVGRLLVEVVTPLTLEVALAVGDELRARDEEVDRLRRQQVEHARYEAELAGRRYRRVDPDNRLVADALEADWNDKLRALSEAQDSYERQRAEDEERLDDTQRAEILALATDFPRLWQDPNTPSREKKRMARFLIEDVTLLRGEQLTAHIRFKGGATRTLVLPLPRPAPDLRRTDPAVIERIDELLDEHTEDEIAGILNAEGLRTGTGLPFNRSRVWSLRSRYDLTTRYERLRQRGLLTADEMATRLGITTQTVRDWRDAGSLKAYAYDCNNRCLYEPPGPDAPKKYAHKAAVPTGIRRTSPSLLQRGAV